ncbi:ATP-dependent helicase brm [Diplonema papillatum]|nr:ATP-dependent helicase brm [Diplonema papillatum]
MPKRHRAHSSADLDWAVSVQEAAFYELVDQGFVTDAAAQALDEVLSRVAYQEPPAQICLARPRCLPDPGRDAAGPDAEGVFLPAAAHVEKQAKLRATLYRTLASAGANDRPHAAAAGSVEDWRWFDLGYRAELERGAAARREAAAEDELHQAFSPAAGSRRARGVLAHRERCVAAWDRRRGTCKVLSARALQNAGAAAFAAKGPKGKALHYLRNRPDALHRGNPLVPNPDQFVSLPPAGRAAVLESAKCKCLLKFLSLSESLLEAKGLTPVQLTFQHRQPPGARPHDGGGAGGEKAALMITSDTEYRYPALVPTAFTKEGAKNAFALVGNRYYRNPALGFSALLRERPLHGSLYPHQVTATTFLERQCQDRMNCVLADDAGTGKATAVLFHLNRTFGKGEPHAIVCPEDSVDKWKLLCAKCLPDSDCRKIAVVTSATDARVAERVARSIELSRRSEQSAGGGALDDDDSDPNGSNPRRVPGARRSAKVSMVLMTYESLPLMIPKLGRIRRALHTLVVDAKNASLTGDGRLAVVSNYLTAVQAKHRVLLASKGPGGALLGDLYGLAQLLNPRTWAWTNPVGFEGWLWKQVEQEGVPKESCRVVVREHDYGGGVNWEGVERRAVVLGREEVDMVAHRLLQVIAPSYLRRPRAAIVDAGSTKEVSVACPLSPVQLRLYRLFCCDAFRAAEGGADRSLAAALLAKASAHPFLVYQHARKIAGNAGPSWILPFDSSRERYADVLTRSSGKTAVLRLLLAQLQARAHASAQHKVVLFTSFRDTAELLHTFLQEHLAEPEVHAMSPTFTPTPGACAAVAAQYMTPRQGVSVLLLNLLPVTFTLGLTDTLILFDDHVHPDHLSLLVGRCRAVNDPISLRLLRLTATFPDEANITDAASAIPKPLPTIDQLKDHVSRSWAETCATGDESASSQVIAAVLRQRYLSVVRGVAAAHVLAARGLPFASFQQPCAASIPASVIAAMGLPPLVTDVAQEETALLPLRHCDDLFRDAEASDGAVLQYYFPSLVGARLAVRPKESNLDLHDEDILHLVCPDASYVAVLKTV